MTGKRPIRADESFEHDRPLKLKRTASKNHKLCGVNRSTTARMNVCKFATSDQNHWQISFRSGCCCNACRSTKSATPGSHGVVCIGSTGDLRKLLGDHLRGSSDNVLLYKHLTDGAARVRFRLVSEEWRWAERDLYRVFCETFGTPPLCNRMSP